MKKTLLALLLTVSSQVCAMEPVTLTIEYDKKLTQMYPGLGTCEWEYDGTDFTVYYQDKIFDVDPLYVDPFLHGITKEALVDFLATGYLFINQFDDGTLAIKAKVRGEGGGFPLLLIGGILLIEGGKALINHLTEDDGVFIDTRPIPAQPQAIPVREKIIQDALKKSSTIKSDGKNVVINPETTAGCVVGPGIPLRPIWGIGGGPAKPTYPPTMPRGPRGGMDTTPTPTRPNIPLPKPLTPLPKTPPLPPPVAPFPA